MLQKFPGMINQSQDQRQGYAIYDTPRAER